MNRMECQLYKPRPERWPILRFRLKTLLVAVAFLGIVLGWFTAQVKWISARHTAFSSSPACAMGHAPAPWSLRLFGEVGYQKVFVVVESGRTVAYVQGEIRRLKLLFPEAEEVTRLTNKHSQP
jgi:hypothetical protein